MTGYSRSRISWAAYAAALWALIFAVFHVIWASGRYVGLDPEQARIAFAKPSFLVYDLVVLGVSGAIELRWAPSNNSMQRPALPLMLTVRPQRHAESGLAW